MTSFTPGPWIAARMSHGYRNKKYGFGTDGDAISFVVAPRSDMGIDDQYLADLRLIAAAPLLYEAAEWAERFLDAHDVTDITEDGEEWEGWLQLRAALAAARGEQP